MRGTKTKYPGIFKTPTGFRVRVRVKDTKTDRYREADRELETSNVDEALSVAVELRAKLGSTGPALARPRVRFEKYAPDLIERRQRTGAIRSPATLKRYLGAAATAPKGTRPIGGDLGHLIRRWGPIFVDAIAREDVKAWRAELGDLVAKGVYKPHSVRGWWTLFRSIMSECAADLGVPDPTAKIEGIDLAAHRTYTHEEPNALTPVELGRFIAAAIKHEPEHAAFLLLGVLTGRRPCELRALRRRGGPSGAVSDINWETGELYIRRSQTFGAAVERTKTDNDLTIGLPASVMQILRNHVASLEGKAAESDLLFPSTETGGYWSGKALNEPIAAICKHAGIWKKITPRFMRRTYTDLKRKVALDPLVARSISGHETDSMERLYGTADRDEQREGLTKILELVGIGKDDDKAA